MKKEEQFYERLVLFLLIVGAAFLYFSVRGAKRAALGEDLASMDFPRGTLLLLMLLCGGRLIGGWLGDRGEKGKGRPGLWTGEGADSVSGQEKSPLRSLDRRTGMTVVNILFYAALWRILGFAMSSLIFSFVQTLILKRDVKRKQAILVAAGITFGIYLVFGVAFGVDFPEPVLELISG